MVFSGNGNIESIFFHDESGKLDYSIDLITHVYEPMFVVSCSYNDAWEYRFCYDRTSYEQVKHAIMDAIFAAENAEQVLNMLSELFESSFEDILIDDGCDEDCEHCGECANEINYATDSKYVN